MKRLCGITIMFSIFAILLMTNIAYAQTGSEKATSLEGLWVALAISVPAAAGAFAVATTGSSAVSAMAEKPEIAGNAIIIVALAEGIAIYGLLVAVLMILIR